MTIGLLLLFIRIGDIVYVTVLQATAVPLTCLDDDERLVTPVLLTICVDESILNLLLGEEHGWKPEEGLESNILRFALDKPLALLSVKYRKLVT